MKLLSGAGLVASILIAAPALSASFQDGLTAYTANRVDEARRIYEQVQQDDAAPAKARADAGRELARIAWLVDRDLATAERRLREADSVGHDRCRTARLYVRVLREGRAFRRAVEVARSGLALCEDPAEADEVRVEGALGALAEAMHDSAPGSAHLAEARSLLAGLSESGKAALPANAAALRLALLSADPDGALNAWRGYFWLGDGQDAPQAMAAWRDKVGGTFAAGLHATAHPRDQAALAEMLMRAGFHEDAAWLAREGDLARRAKGSPAWTRTAAYLDLRLGFDAATHALNRSLAKGGARDMAGYQTQVQRLTTAAAAALGVGGDPRQAVFDQLGLYGTVGLTGGYPSAHIGHVVRDERRSVEQYGRRGEVRFIVVDNVLANGFESWLWDGRATAGGWAENGSTIIQVRPAYTDRPLKAWLMTHDTPARRRWEQELPALEQRDLEVLAASRIAYLPGVDARLSRQAIEQIASRAGGSGAAGRGAFLDEYERAVSQHSIFIHEGRHVLDQASGESLSPEELEYRAKLSELALADYPRLPLAGINGDTIGTDTPHGRANSRIIAAYAQWMAAHRDAIPGLDPKAPLLAQLDRLSDDQIRAVARSLDPWTPS